MTSLQRYCRPCLALLAYIAFPLTGCSPPGEDTGASPPAAGKASKGEIVFEQQCGSCHGPGGRGPSLVALQALSSDELREGIRNHPPAGDIPIRLPASEISDLIQYLEE